MSYRTLSLLIGIAVTIPLPVLAMEQIEWSFLQSQVPGRWEVTRIESTVKSPEGLRVTMQREGQMVRPSEFEFPVEAAILVFGPSKPFEGIFQWHIPGAPKGEMVQLPFYVTGKDNPELVRLPLTNYKQWSTHADHIGLWFPADTDATLQSMQFFHWNLGEKMVEAVRSFWTFDGFRPYTINFVWGPRLGFNPITRVRLFHVSPPLGWSGYHAVYGLLACAGGLAVFLWKRSFWSTKRSITMFIAVTIGVWIFMDLRMGSEFLHYVLQDYRSYISVPPGERRLRERGRFNDFVDAALPFVAGRKKYLFMGALRWPFFGEVRYLTYPSIPIDPTGSSEGVDTVLVYDRPDIHVNERSQMMYKDQVLSTSGTILLQFDPTSFVFRIH